MRACAPARAGVSSARGSCISASTAGPTPALPGTRSPRRCSPTACTSWAARSSITPARCACIRRRGAQRAGGRAPRRRALHAQPARHPARAVRGTRSAQSEPLAEPCLRPRRRQRSARPVHPGRVLLQDLHVATARVAIALRAAHSRRRRPRTLSHRGRPRPVRLALRPLRRAHRGCGPAGLAAAAAAAASGARVMLCDEQNEFGARCLQTTRARPRPSRAAPPRSG